MKNSIKLFKNKMRCLPWIMLSKYGFYKGNNIPIKFIIENADWAIKFVGENIKREIDIIAPGNIEVSTKPYKVVKNIVHFGSQYMWLNWGKHLSNENQFITSFFHGKPEDGDDIKIHINLFLESVERLEKVVTASSLIERRLLKWGVPQNKLIKIPLGVNTSFFKLPKRYEINNIRNFIGIPSHSIVIGSFQKDGIGWKDGFLPKLIKGPDLFISTLRILASKGYPVFALLTGPARGYVKRELESNGIPYYHTYLTNHNDLKSLYHALDIYLITSREEGGPMGLLESIASGVPVVTTNVGMAMDVIEDGKTGAIADEITPKSISDKVEKIIQMSLTEKYELQKNARENISKFDWKIVAEKHFEKIYKPLMR